MDLKSLVIKPKNYKYLRNEEIYFIVPKEENKIDEQEEIDMEDLIKKEIDLGLNEENSYSDQVCQSIGDDNHSKGFGFEDRYSISKGCSSIKFDGAYTKDLPQINATNSSINGPKPHQRIKKRVICDHCDKLVIKKYLKKHIRLVHQQQFTCTECDFKANKKRDLRFHFNSTHLNIKSLYSSQCDNESDCRSNLMSDSDKSKCVLKQTFKCAECDYEATNKGNLKKHQKSVHSSTYSLNCSHCDFKPDEKVSLDSHMNRVHLKLKPYKCSECNYEARWKPSLTHHRKVAHLNPILFQCLKCEFKSDKQIYLKQHIDKVHLNLSFKFKCSECDFEANSKWEMWYHVDAIHLKSKAFHCPDCDYKANRKAHLQYHLKTHF